MTITLNKTNVAQLEQSLRDLIETERQSFVKLFSERIERHVQNFLDKRKPNQFLEDFYQMFGPPEGVREVLTLDTEQDAVKNRRLYKIRKEELPAFSYGRDANADAIIQKIAERSAEELIQAFIHRALEKLGPVVERKGEYVIAKTTYGHSGFERASGHWEGCITLDFEDGTTFSASLTIITNFSKFGKPFGQYPMRFFNCALDPTAEEQGRMGSASIEQIWASVGYVPPPPAKKPRWAKVVSGSVLLSEGKHYMVSTPSKLAKMGLTDYEQVARIESQSYGARIEDNEGTVQRYELTPDEKTHIEALEHHGRFNLASARRREFAFQALFGEGQDAGVSAE